MIDPDIAKMHREGYIHIHDLDFYGWTTTCTQIELRKLFKGGFNTGHGHLREPKSIGSYAALAAIAIQSNQNDQHGGQSIVDFDYAMGDGVRLTYERYLREAFEIRSALTNRIDYVWQEEENHPRHVSGDGGIDSQPEYHALESRRTGSIQQH